MREALAGMTSLLCIGVVVGLMVSGCEETTGRALTISPANPPTLVGTSNSVVFTVQTNSLDSLSLPIQWRVSNPGLGSINAVGGLSAIYYRTGGGGDNIIIARDQYGAEGIATVHQR